MNPGKSASRTIIKLVLTMSLVFCACNPSFSLNGKWVKTSSEICTLAQPNELEFFDDGTYVGALPNWKGGNYRVVDAGRVRIETTTGPGVYKFKISGDSLVFNNDNGCEFRYRRAG